MPSVTISPYIHPSYRRADGTYPVRIKVYCQKKSRYLTTNIIVRQEQLSRRFTIRDAAVRDTINTLIRQMQDRVNLIPIEKFNNATIDDIVKMIVSEGIFRLDFPDYAYKIAAEKSYFPKQNFLVSIRSFCRFIGEDHFDISVITSPLLRNYEKYLVSKHGENGRAVSLYTQTIAYIHRRAREEYNQEELGEIRIRNPYSVYRCPRMKTSGKKRVMTRETIQKLIDFKCDGDMRYAIDVFLISFALMGTNVPDLYKCRIKDGVVMYNRTKTQARRTDGAEMRIKIDPLVIPLMSKYIKGDRFVFAERFKTYTGLSRMVNDTLHKWYTENCEEPFTIYYGRHTWATLAYSLGVDKYTINDCLCHSDHEMRVTDIYIEKDWSILWKANHKVLKSFRWQLTKQLK